MTGLDNVAGLVTHRAIGERAWGLWTGRAVVGHPSQDATDQDAGQELPQELPPTLPRRRVRSALPDSIWRLLFLVASWGNPA